MDTSPEGAVLKPASDPSGKARQSSGARPIEAWGGALLGARSSQQDCFVTDYLKDEDAWFAIVADGMGGHAAGALASQTAASAFRSEFLRRRAERASLEAALKGGLDVANTAIAEAQKDRPDRAGMGTTLLAVLASAQGLAWISVGDSALLLFHDDEVRRLNADHSLRGLPEFNGQQGNLLRSAVAGAEIPLVDCRADPLHLEPGDVVLLASDGLLTLSGPELRACLRDHAGRPERLGTALLEAVTRKDEPRQDNCTVVAITGAGSPAPAPATPGMGWGRLTVVAGLGVALLCMALIALFW